LGGLWTFVAFQVAAGLVGFMLRQFEIAWAISLRPRSAIAFSAPIAVFLSVFIIYLLRSLPFAPWCESRSRWLHFFMLFVPVAGLWASAIGVVGLAFNAIAFSAPIAVFLSVFIIYPLGQSAWFFAPSFDVAGIFPLILLVGLGRLHFFMLLGSLPHERLTFPEEVLPRGNAL
jgi:hypothetical protein